jgi:hypothetical protein
VRAVQPVRRPVITLINTLASRGSNITSFGLSLDSLTANELRLVRNTLFARSGYAFKDPALQQFFSAFPWYRATGNVTLPAGDQLLAECIGQFENTKKQTPLRAPIVRVTGTSAQLLSDGAVQWRNTRIPLEPYGSFQDVIAPDCLGLWKDPQYRTAILRPTEPHVALKEFATRNGPVLLVSMLGHLDEEDPDTDYSVLYTTRDGSVQRLGIAGQSAPVIGADGVISRTVTTCDFERGVIETFRERYLPDARGRYRTPLRETIRTEKGGCAACPFVYAAVADTFAFQGEILRNLSSKAQETTQTLTIPAAASRDGVVHIELRELKDEITYLDEIALEVDGHQVAPMECTPTSTFCRADARYRVLRRGETLRLTFQVPAHRWRQTTLRARGYYLPRPRILSEPGSVPHP